MSAPARPDATLRLPTALGYALAAVALAGAMVQPFALATAGRGLAEAAQGYELQTTVLFGLLGAVILHRRPGHVIGWVLVGIGGFGAVVQAGGQYALLGLDALPGFPSAGSVDRLTEWAWVPAAAGMTIALPLLFPTGRLLSRRWRGIAAFGAAATGLLVGTLVADPQGGGPLDAVAYPLFGLASLSALVSFAVRYRRSRGVGRQQLKWVFYGLALCLPLVVLGTTGVSLVAASPAWALPSAVIIPVTITVAVLRYRLFDIDVVISRTLLVAGLAGFITIAYVAIVVGLGSVLGGGSDPDPGLSLVATAVVAVAFQPVRLALHRVANRLVHGRRATPYDVLSGFATRIAAAEPSPDTLARLAELMAGGTGADPARVWLRVGAQLRPAATWPAREGAGPDAVDTAATTTLPDADLALPVRDRDELLGVLTIAKPRGERVTDADADLLGRLAAAAGVLLRNLRLDAELADRLSDIEASRLRLVTAQDEARRRIEADLAGGARAQLAGLREQLSGLARDADPATAPRTATMLVALVAQTGTALDTLDGLAAGIYPPRLAADGLAAALTEQADRAAIPVTVGVDGIGRYARDVEIAAYFCVLEALQNVAKYSGAGSARVRLTHDGATLRFEVVDDGAGFDTATTAYGTGLQGMADRLDTVGGTLTVRSVPGDGTTVAGEIAAMPVAEHIDRPLTGALR